jgi:hypothetical protein
MLAQNFLPDYTFDYQRPDPDTYSIASTDNTDSDSESIASYDSGADEDVPRIPAYEGGRY